MVYGYLGVHDEKTDFMKLNEEGCDSIYKESDTSQTELRALVRKLKKGDKLIILRPQNLGLTLDPMINYVNRILKKQADIVCPDSEWLNSEDARKKAILQELIEIQSAQKLIKKSKGK